MKVILQKDVANVGRKLSVVTVPDGFALNSLIPSGKAIPATPANMQKIAHQTKLYAAEQENVQQAFSAAAEKLNAEPLVIEMSANENGQLFQAVTSKEISQAAELQGVSVSPEVIHIGTTIKSVGEHNISLVLGDQQSVIKITVVASS